MLPLATGSRQQLSSSWTCTHSAKPRTQRTQSGPTSNRSRRSDPCPQSEPAESGRTTQPNKEVARGASPTATLRSGELAIHEYVRVPVALSRLSGHPSADIGTPDNPPGGATTFLGKDLQSRSQIWVADVARLILGDGRKPGKMEATTSAAGIFDSGAPGAVASAMSALVEQRRRGVSSPTGRSLRGLLYSLRRDDLC
jgi:hypothetical protein